MPTAAQARRLTTIGGGPSAASCPRRGRARKKSRALLGIRGRRTIVLAVFLGLWGTAPVVNALGLGPLEVQSNLGSPLQATAPIQLAGGESGEELEVALASQADYQMVGKPRPPVVGSLKVQLVDGDSPAIRITSVRPIEDPLFEVMVRISAGGNQVLKMYTVALNPPQVTEPSSRSQAPAPPPPAQSRAPEPGPSPDRPRVQTRELPAQARQQSERPSQPSQPTAEAGPAVDRPDVEVTEGWAKRDRYGPVREGDTLTTIVQRLRRDDSVPLESAVVATWKANSEAFIDGNMNLIRQGAVLQVPSESEVRQYQAGEARSIIRKQREEWVERGKPEVKPSPGHERYKLKVSLQDPDGSADTTASPADSQEEGQAASDAGDGQGSGAGEGGSKEGASSGEESGSGESREGSASPENAAMIAELRTRIGELQQSLKNQRTDSQATVQAMEERISGLQEKLEKQRNLVAEQNAAMERLTQQAKQSGGGDSGVPGRDRYILWMLAAVNLLMLLAIVALWRRLRAVQAGSAGGGTPSEEDNPGDTDAQDPLTRANAQAAAGEFKQARSTLWQALAGNPQNWAVYGRLLDLYEQEEDADQFEEVARRLFEQLGDRQPEWREEVRSRGQRLKPESNLFAAAAAGAAAASSAPPTFDFEGLDLESTDSGKGEAASSEESGEDLEAPAEQGMQSPEDDSIELDFSESPAEEESAGAPEASPETEAAAPEEEEGLDLGFQEGGEEPGSPEPEAAAAQADEEEGLEFDLGMAEEEPESPPGAGAESSEEAPGAASAPPDEGGEDELELSGWEADSEPGTEESAAGEGTEFGEEELGLDLDLGEPEDGGTSAASGSGEDAELGAGDLGDLGWEDEAPQEEELAGPGGEGQEDDLDFQVAGWGSGEETLEGDSGWSEEASGAQGETGDEEDEFEIKLDLAQAWIDMGDQDSARGLLEEVENRGAPPQQERAQKMIASLS